MPQQMSLLQLCRFPVILAEMICDRSISRQRQRRRRHVLRVTAEVRWWAGVTRSGTRRWPDAVWNQTKVDRVAHTLSD